MILILDHEDIDRIKWDNAVRSSCFPATYGFSWYLDIVSPEWWGMVVDDYAAVLPLPVRRKWGFTYLAQPPFTQQLGVFSINPVDAALMRTLVLHLMTKIPFADIQLNETNQVAPDGFEIFHRKNILLPLDKSYNQVEQSYHSQVRRNLSNFRSSALRVVRRDSAFEQVIHLFRKGQGKKYRQISGQDYEVMKILCHQLLERERLDVRMVKDIRGELVAGAIFLEMQERYVFLFSANSEAGYAGSAMSAIIDAFVKDHAGKKSFLDFEGSENPGLARFYLSFGGEERYYLRIRYNRLPWWIRFSKG